MSYKVVLDDREPVMIDHSEICYPPPHPDLIDHVDTSFPGIVIKYENGYSIEDGVHRMAKLQKQGIFRSLFYVVSQQEYKDGVVGMKFIMNGQRCWTKLGEWNHDTIDPQSHNK